MTEKEGGMRASVTEFLPDALSKALNSYQDFSEREYENEKPKAFKEHHDSCKAAISHVELLLKLAEKFDVLGSETFDDNALAVMIESARSEVGKYKEIKN